MIKIKKIFASYEKYASIRDSKGLNDYKISKETEITKSTFSDWKSNKSKPKINKLIKISQALDVPMESLLEEKEEI